MDPGQTMDGKRTLIEECCKDLTIDIRKLHDCVLIPGVPEGQHNANV